jgi:anti-anti-sigma factor
MHEPPAFLQEEGPDEHTSVLVASGDLEYEAGGYVNRWVAEQLRTGRRRLIIDLSKAGYLDSRALAALIAAGKQAAVREGCGVAVVTPSDTRLRIIFELTQVDRFLHLSETRADALAALA